MTSDQMSVLTVTYGERAALLEKTATSVLTDDRVHLVVVSNGSSVATLELLERLSSAHPDRLTVIPFKYNQGSAPAFSAGLRAAYDRDTPILILDDDNPVGPETLRGLRDLATFAPNATKPFAIAVHRPINEAQRAILRGEPADRVFKELAPGAFHGFDLFARLRRSFRAQHRSTSAVQWRKGQRAQTLHHLPVAMWGGLYLSKEAARLRTLPLEDLVLYGDDNDFSRALTEKGCAILLTDAFCIDDTEAWRPGRDMRRGWRRHLPSTVSTPDSEIWRLEYLFRNQAYLSRCQAAGARGSCAQLAVNAGIRMTLMALLALIAGRPRLGVRLTRASMAGLRGRLGRSYPLPQ